MFAVMGTNSWGVIAMKFNARHSILNTRNAAVRRALSVPVVVAAVAAIVVALTDSTSAADPDKKAPPTSYSPVLPTETFDAVVKRMTGDKAKVEDRQQKLLEERYDLSDRPASGAKMFRGKPVQAGPRAKLPAGVTWDSLGKMSADEIRDGGKFPKGFLPLPHPNHPEGGMLFPKFHIDEIKKQESRDLTRFDLDFDLPDRFLPEFPAPIFLTTRPDLGDVSKGKLVTIDNFFDLFNGILNPKQLEGVRLLVTPFPQQQFNQTDDRRSLKASRGVT
jgi:cytochrome c peroxidase